MAIKKKPHEEEHAEGWIVSFADLMTLMMSFFVVLFALKESGSPQKQMEVTAAIKAQFGYEPPENSTDPLDIMVMNLRGRGSNLEKNAGNAEKSPKGAEGNEPEVTTIRAGNEITTGTFITFDAGSSEPDPNSIRLIRKIADMRRGYNNVMLVKGHVSADEVAMRPDDPNGMGLSYKRAMVVCDYLKSFGIDSRVLRPVACGPYEPLKVQAYDQSSMRQNRRVEIYSTESTVSDYFPSTTVRPVGDTAPAETSPLLNTPTTNEHAR